METLAQELKAVKDEVAQTLSSLTQGEMNTMPFEGSWTAAQVAEHIRNSDKLIAKTVNGPTKETEREPDMHVKILKDLFLDLGHKMKSPDMLVPAMEAIEKEQLLKDSEGPVKELIAAAEDPDLSATCTGFALPRMGELTRKEWLYFNLYHTQRHLHQLKNIVRVLRERKLCYTVTGPTLKKRSDPTYISEFHA